MKKIGLTRVEFAKRDGCDERLVRRGIAEGHLTTLPDGSLDERLVGSPWRATNRALPHNQPNEEMARARADSLEQANLLPTQAQSLQKKEYFLALLNELKYMKESGEVVELDVAERVFFEQARASRDVWLNFSSRIGPRLAADLNLPADKVTEALTVYVHEAITGLGEPAVDFRRQD